MNFRLSHWSFQGAFLFAMMFVSSSEIVAQQTGDDSNQIDYKLTLKSEVEMEIGGVEKALSADTRVRYSNVREGNKIELLFRETQLTIEVDDEKQEDITMNAEFVDDRISGQKILLEDAPEQLEAMLTDSYGHVLSEFTLDEHGGSLNRKDFQTANNKDILEQVGAARLLHAPFHRDKSKWEAPVTVGIGNGGTADGVLTYEIKSKDTDGKSTVSVSGELIPIGGKPPAKISGGLMKVSGTQVYDPKINAWESGLLKMKIKFNVEVDGEVVAVAEGDMNFDVSIEE